MAACAALDVIVLPLPSGKKLAILKSAWRGATGACYAAGGDYCLCVAESFMGSGQRKATVGVNMKTNPDGSVSAFLATLNALEPGAGGPPTGQVGGSKMGCQIPLQKLIDLAMDAMK
jgi:hypothetical protein